MSKKMQKVESLFQPNDDLCLIDLDILLHQGTDERTSANECNMTLALLGHYLHQNHFNVLHLAPHPDNTYVSPIEFPSIPFERGSWVEIDVLKPRWLTVRKLDYVKTEKKTFQLYVVDYSPFQRRLTYLLEPLANELGLGIEETVHTAVDSVVRYVYNLYGERHIEVADYLKRTFASTTKSPLSQLLDEFKQFIEGVLSNTKGYYLHLIDTQSSTITILTEKETKE